MHAIRLALYAPSSFKRFCLRKLNQQVLSSTSAVSNMQLAQMESEKCVLVDLEDQVLGSASKLACHRRLEDGSFRLHRAFSVFLFNDRKELLLQRRAASKLTFPSYLTNTCCSHPRYTEDELEAAGFLGIKRAAQRRLEFELGIPADQMPLEALHFVTRVHYAADYDQTWGEHEMDYILVCKRDVSLHVNSDEVAETKYMGLSDLQALLKDAEASVALVTPWFRYVAETFLDVWWHQLDNVELVEQETLIHRAGYRTTIKRM